MLVGIYILIYLGLISENMQIEGFWYYLFTGVFELQQSIMLLPRFFGALILGERMVRYACWTAMVLIFFV